MGSKMSNRAQRRKDGQRGPLVARIRKHRNDAEAPTTAPAFTFRWPRGASETRKVAIPGVDWAEQRQQWNANNLCARQACDNTLGKRYGVYNDHHALKYCVWCAREIQRFQGDDKITFVDERDTAPK